MSLRWRTLALSLAMTACGPTRVASGVADSAAADGKAGAPSFDASAVIDAGGVTDGGRQTDANAFDATLPLVDAGSFGMRAVGNRLQRDGADFVAHGFNMVGLLTPIACGCNQGTGKTANAHLTEAWLRTLTAPPWSANMLRFQVSQRGLADPTLCTTSTAQQAYLSEIVNGVATIRKATSPTFPIILSMQDQSIGCGNVDPLPSTMTQAAWDILAPHFKDDPYVLFELFNEPQNIYSNSAEWIQWHDGGAAGGLTSQGGAVIGHQTLVDHVRSVVQVDNVLIVDVANYAEHAEGVIPILDRGSGRGIVYGIHPYTYAPQGLGTANTLAACEAAYAQRWQFIPTELNQPILITEWNYKPADCGTGKQQYAPDFLGYCSGGLTMTSQNAMPVGLLAHAGDVAGIVISSWNTDGTISPTTCPSGASGWGLGPGMDVQKYYGQL